MSLAPKLNYTPEDLLSMPDRGRYDLIDGQLVERNMSFESSMVAVIIDGRLSQHVLAHRLGWFCGPDGGLQIFPDSPHKVRFAAGAFISRERSPGRPTQGHLRIAPELVIEVVSPNDVAADVNERSVSTSPQGSCSSGLSIPSRAPLTFTAPARATASFLKPTSFPAKTSSPDSPSLSGRSSTSNEPRTLGIPIPRRHPPPLSASQSPRRAGGHAPNAPCEPHRINRSPVRRGSAHV